ncbi:hypothetical protein [Brevundimonas goettingensis]|uniref:Uncharacterized protein n=1 Tax=Brevundimonas goettingensis TaxID=2774190 RepID=A0A975C267_9CAUL|nr:hypothetical protein [Brevundimonas goettingensis]QTC90465.1 hypothetical protein IFJ75_14440 [Brevundimonas goettingensis]
MGEIKDSEADRRAVVALAERFDWPPDLHEATVAELNDTWAQIAATLSANPAELAAQIAYFGSGPDLDPEGAARAVSLLEIVLDFQLEDETLEAVGMFNDQNDESPPPREA